MRIHGLCVCVDYASLLKDSILSWKNGCDRFVVVTTSRDRETLAMCEFVGVETHVTDIFYANGAAFNKGAALSEAICAKGMLQSELPPLPWILTVDADVTPPRFWREVVRDSHLISGHIYGAFRTCGLRVFPDTEIAGFFTMFHASDPRLISGRVFGVTWPHAGNYDTAFTERWPLHLRHTFPLVLTHVGEPRKNWMGVSPERQNELAALLARRGNRPDAWRDERMANPPRVG